MFLKKVESSLTPCATQIGIFENETGELTEVFFRTQAEIPLPDRTDHFFIIGVVAAYLRGEPYTHLGWVSQRLYDNLNLAMQKWQDWWHLPAIKVTAQTLVDAEGSAHRRFGGCLMTGGVDSLFTAHSQSERIDAIVHVIHRPLLAGCDVQAPQQRAGRTIADLADALGKKLFLIESNIMTAFPEIEDSWSSISHGACYATVGHFLSAEMTDLIISASFATDQMRPWGSHPDADGLYSSDRLTFQHIGTERNRFQKHREIAMQDLYLQHLSVCEHGPQTGAHINCSSCQKCLRSMITLDLLGIDPAKAPTFDWQDYRPEKLGKFLLQGAVNTQELLDYAEQIGRDDIARILKDVIAHANRHNWIVQTELFLRRRMNRWLKYKPFLKRVRSVVYRLLFIRPRHQSQPRSPQNLSKISNLEHLHD